MLKVCYCLLHTTKHLKSDICRTTLIECFWVVVFFPHLIHRTEIFVLCLSWWEDFLSQFIQAALLLWCPCFANKYHAVGKTKVQDMEVTLAVALFPLRFSQTICHQLIRQCKLKNVSSRVPSFIVCMTTGEMKKMTAQFCQEVWASGEYPY